MPGDNEYYFGFYFYAPQGRFEPCGMFTAGHIISAIICIFIVIGTFLIIRKRNNEIIRTKLSCIFAILLTVLEVIKIAHSFIFGDYYLDAWFPLSYCGLFIFAVWMAGYCKGFIKRAGEVFIAYGCPVAGLAFLIFPTTSLMSFPIWHYFSLYSLFFHTSMMFMGVTYLSKEGKLNRRNYLAYISFIIIFAIPAIIMNLVFNCNLMNLREPYNIPIALLQNLYNNFQPGYTALVLTGYMLIPAVIGGISGKFAKNKQERG